MISNRMLPMYMEFTTPQNSSGSSVTSCGHELGIVIEAVAGTQELANTICAFARSTMLHHGYPGRIST
ncbi:MAG TPA: hypothetical protein VNP92_23650, partial [Actinophytocola sp.]|nr:hypothetical protein [Actinophytocola sp.]